ncbi:MAG: neutral/alkaline non-lysosomal ceramidase N-terminal domain-containing protein [Anaerolineae bacterium]
MTSWCLCGENNDEKGTRSMASQGFSVGFGTADITPAMGIQLAGDIGRQRPMEEVRHPLKARALVVESAGKRVCVVMADVISISRPISLQLRTEIAQILGTAPEAVLLHAVQSHSTPAVGHSWLAGHSPWVPDDLWWVLGEDDRYLEPFSRGVILAVRSALAKLAPATLHLGRGMDGRAAFNRRFIMRDGTAKCHPAQNSPDILHVEGPTDPEVGVAVFKNPAGAPLGTILHHTCHPCHGYPMLWAHPDWPGLWAEEVAAALGAPDTALTLNGACGNIHHRNHIDPAQQDTIEHMTAYLTETALKVAAHLTPCEDTTLSWRTVTLDIPWRKLSRIKIAEAKALLKQYPQPKYLDEAHTAISWDWCYAVAAMDLARQQKEASTLPYDITVLRIGGLALVGWPGEPFVESQLAVKVSSPAPNLFVAHMTNGDIGYQPDAAAIKRGGYETWVANTSKLSARTPELVVARTREMVEGLFGGDARSD